MSKENDKAIAALKHIFEYAKHEQVVCERHAAANDERKDYRAADRDASHGKAFQKVAAKCSAYAREKFMASLEDSQ